MAGFNSDEYGWHDITVVIGGRIIEGITGISYTKKKDKSILYGRGVVGKKIVHGAVSCEGKIKLWQSELEAMTRDAPDKDILNLKFNVSIAYVPKGGGQTVVDIMANCEFTEEAKEINQGDKNIVVELPIICLDIKRQE